VHLAGKRIAKATGVPWLADFRDPWTMIFYRDKLPTSSLVDRFEKKLEDDVVKSADAVLVVSARDQAYFENIRGSRVGLITNGFDPADLPNEIVESADLPRRSRLVLSHVGVMNETRNPTFLWTALASLKTDIEVRLIGRIDDVVREQVISKVPDVVIEPNVAHEVAVRKMFDADLLLFTVNQGDGNDSMIPAKIFEYLATGKPILGIGPVDGDAAVLLRDLDAGAVYAYEDSKGIQAFLKRHVEAWQDGRPISGCASEAVQQFSRRDLAGRLADELTAISGAS
jgi:glycosyltransferase involved in cell wall biosynthesis